MTQLSSRPAEAAHPRSNGRRLTSVSGQIRRRPLTSFFVLSCLLSWWAAIPYLAGASPLPIASFGPFLAALVVLGLTEGRDGVGRLLRRIVRWRVPIRAYALALGLPALISAMAVLATMASGAATEPDKLTAWVDVPVNFLVALLIPGLGGAWEEPGFRGYALSRLEARFGPLSGPLLLGVFWVFWHLPLFLAGQIVPTDVAVIIAASMVTAAVFHTAKDSVLVAMILHATNNAAGGSYASQIFHGTDLWLLGLYTAIGWWTVALVILAVQRRRHSRLDRP